MINIRDFEENDFEFLLEMLYESIHIPHNKATKEKLLNLPHIKKYYEGWGREGDKALIAINKDNQKVGAVWYRLFDEYNKGYGYVDNNTPELGIAISKDARGMGLGTLLMNQIIQIAIEEEYKSISLSVDPDNSDAVHIYKKIGFKQCGMCGTSITMVYKVLKQG
ncbi:GNAT family N-acetyltransferase [Viridibacillus sp. YIM B01967]|uniref:GNAT family N-acetyltransferase n=1 Tax=Viridibacillus soli TaxID=2798301 RepID=A0ABS1HAJ8_9BACL|nr:GNAT family N-acetyltransferase [Viridibacillus soli]MBK3496435.1 GNAT family N-acetyltransferase [Viridibacillus soli]